MYPNHDATTARSSADTPMVDTIVIGHETRDDRVGLGSPPRALGRIDINGEQRSDTLLGAVQVDALQSRRWTPRRLAQRLGCSKQGRSPTRIAAGRVRLSETFHCKRRATPIGTREGLGQTLLVQLCRRDRIAFCRRNQPKTRQGEARALAGLGGFETSERLPMI